MKILMKATMAGPSVFRGADTVVEVSEIEGKSLIAAGYAEAVSEDEEPAIETAEDTAPVLAEKRPGRKAKRK